MIYFGGGKVFNKDEWHYISCVVQWIYILVVFVSKLKLVFLLVYIMEGWCVFILLEMSIFFVDELFLGLL